MLFASVTFVIVMLIMVGGYWAVVLRPEGVGRSAAMERLQPPRPGADGAGVVLAEAKANEVPLLDTLLRGRQDLIAPLERALLESDLKLTVGGFLVITALAAVVAAVLGWAVARFWPIAIVTGLIGSLLPLLYVSRARAVRLRTFEEQFPEAVDLISRALRAGHALTTGLGMVADEIPAPVGPEFRRLYDEQNFGMSLPDALREMARRVPVLDARFFVTALLTQRESGGNLAEVLDNLSGVMRERFKLKRQIRVISAHGRLSAWVLSALPPALGALLFAISPDFMRVLWEDPLGVRLVVIAVLLQITGTLVITRMVRIEY